MQLRDVWSGRVPAGHVLALAEQLQLNPYSRVRMIQLGGDIRWIGWDAAAEAAAATHDLIVGVATGLSGKKVRDKDLYPRPGKQMKTDESNLFAPSIADFNVGAFMSVINQ